MTYKLNEEYTADKSKLTERQLDLVKENLGLAHYVTNRENKKHNIVEQGVEYEDQLQIAFHALCRAAYMYNPEKSNNFAAYASTSIRHALISNARNSFDYISRNQYNTEIDDTLLGTEDLYEDEDTEEQTLKMCALLDRELDLPIKCEDLFVPLLDGKTTIADIAHQLDIPQQKLYYLRRKVQDQLVKNPGLVAQLFDVV